ncbi:hypothetical protein KVR01_007729 [Diaporthe batatas]|uniref:uncharacterized protein n=1 Tax=Diaporthe batatas TaxID=748121 RepID=UPI001D050AAC|nr:uncharacterized protein KVR01_007729 [Diaporthe batatas]KAG8161964.1 hypothetical protein KVR01_007729 [Diaporthe batatas]
MSTTSPYNEAMIVSLIKEYYSLLISLSYLRASQIVSPPPSGHVINEKLCNSLGLDAAVISLMKKLPYIDGPYSAGDGQLDQDASAYGCLLFPGSWTGSLAYSFLRDDDIMESRDPYATGTQGYRLNYLLGHDIALAHNLRDGMTLVLDTKANTVRMLDNNDSPEVVNPEGTPLERPEEPMYYRNYHAQDATAYFKTLIADVRSLEYIPYGGDKYDREFFSSDAYPEICAHAKKVLLDEYGWGSENFRQDQWAADAERVLENIIHESGS